MFGFFVGVCASWLVIQNTNFGKTIVAKGPNSQKITQKTFYDEKTKKYHKFSVVTHICPPSINVDEFEHSSE